MKSNIMFVLGAAILLCAPCRLLAQENTPQIIEVNVDTGKVETAPVRVELRPNTPMVLGFLLKNRGKDDLKDVSVRFTVQNIVLGEAKIKTLPPTPAGGKGELVLLFDKLKGAPDKAELLSPPFRIQVQVDARVPKDLAPVKQDVDLVIREPRKYIPSPVATFDNVKRQLHFVVRSPAADDFIGPHRFPVQLILGSELKLSKKGIFADTLRGLKQEIDLLAEDVAFQNGLTEGEAYLKIDGYDRAFTYPVKLTAPGVINPRPAGEIRVRIPLPRYAKPNAKFEVPLEIDGPLGEDYRVTVGYDPIDKSRFRDERVLNGLREQKALLAVSKEGAIVCLTAVNDWKLQFDTSGISRDIWWRVYVSKKNPKTGAYEKVKVTPYEDVRPGVARVVSPDGTDLFALVSQGESTPEGLRFVDLPKQWPVGKPLEFAVRIAERTPDQAPIAKVICFRGKLKDDKQEIKFEDIIEKDEAPDAKRTEWIFRIPPQVKPETMIVSVLIVSRTGERAMITDSVEFVPAKVAGKMLYKIKGIVKHGDLVQPDLTVTLMDAKRKALATAKTGPKGDFVFEEVEPGTYIVASSRSFLNLVGESAPFPVPGKDKKDVNVNLTLMAK